MSDCSVWSSTYIHQGHSSLVQNKTGSIFHGITGNKQTSHDKVEHLQPHLKPAHESTKVIETSLLTYIRVLCFKIKSRSMVHRVQAECITHILAIGHPNPRRDNWSRTGNLSPPNRHPLVISNLSPTVTGMWPIYGFICTIDDQATMDEMSRVENLTCVHKQLCQVFILIRF